MRKFTRFVSCLSLLLLLVTWATPQAWAQTPVPATTIKITQVDTSKFPQVTVYVSVTDASGQPVGVDPSAIQISENGQVMKTANANNATGPSSKGQPGQLTTLLVIDVSGSMATAGKLTAAKAAAKAYVDQMRPGDQAGVVAFDTQVNVAQPITADHAALTKAIDSLQSGTDTAMFDALVSAEQLLAKVGGRKGIVLLTDGLDNRSKGNADAVINAIGPSGLTISTIGLGNPQDPKNSLAGIDEGGLKDLAQKAGGIYTYEPDPSQLGSIFQQYGNALQSEYALSYTSPATLRDGVNRSLSVSLNGGTAAIQSQYNPGGVLPEVASQNWMLFGGILLLLLILLALPFLANLGLRSIRGGAGGSKKGRIKFAGQTSTTSPAPAKGRVKFK